MPENTQTHLFACMYVGAYVFVSYAIYPYMFIISLKLRAIYINSYICYLHTHIHIYICILLVFVLSCLIFVVSKDNARIPTNINISMYFHLYIYSFIYKYIYVSGISFALNCKLSVIMVMCSRAFYLSR